MIKTKTNPDAIEQERERARNLFVLKGRAASVQENFKHVDFVKHYSDPRLYSLATFEPIPEIKQ